MYKELVSILKLPPTTTTKPTADDDHGRQSSGSNTITSSFIHYTPSPQLPIYNNGSPLSLHPLQPRLQSPRITTIRRNESSPRRRAPRRLPKANGTLEAAYLRGD